MLTLAFISGGQVSEQVEELGSTFDGKKTLVLK